MKFIKNIIENIMENIIEKISVLCFILGAVIMGGILSWVCFSIHWAIGIFFIGGILFLVGIFCSDIKDYSEDSEFKKYEKEKRNEKCK